MRPALPSAVVLAVASTLLAGLATLTGVAPAGATPSGGADPTSATRRAWTEGERVLAQARRALDGDEHLEASMALSQLFSARPALDDDQRELADAVLARPTDGRRDPLGDGYTTKSVQTCAAHVCVHWVRSTRDQPPNDAWARTTLKVMEQVWKHHIGRLGYRAPASDRGRGGNAKFDVYLKELGRGGLFGYCTPEQLVPGSGNRASGYCVLDDDFARSQFGRAPKDSLRVTAAHEFFHAIQYNYDYDEDQWLLESTATWMEEQFADDVNDNRAYLRFGQVRSPQHPLDEFDRSGFGHYGNWAFWKYLSERYGRGIVRQVIQRAGTGGGLPNDYSVQALRRVLASHGGLTAVFAAYAGGNTAASRTYAEGKHFPTPVYAAKKELSARSPHLRVRTRIDHLAAKHVLVGPADSLGRRAKLRITVDAPKGRTSPAAYVVVRKMNGKIERRRVALSSSGAGSTMVRFDAAGVSAVSVTLANASTRYRCGRGTTYACSGRAKDDGLVFRVGLDVVRR